MRKVFISIIVLFIIQLPGFTQSSNIDSLVYWSSKFLDKNVKNELKNQYNIRFIETLTEELEQKSSTDYSYEGLKSVSIQSSPDKSYRIFTWLILEKSGYACHGLVQTTSKKLKNPVVTKLIDQGEDLRSAQFKTLNANLVWCFIL
jgi:hypothetical protein